MEVLTTTRGPFHDPHAKWVSRFEENTLVILVGSEQDRIRLAFTPDEARKILGIWAEHLVENREWQTPVGEKRQGEA